jgi:hypothetical protein
MRRLPLGDPLLIQRCSRHRVTPTCLFESALSQREQLPRSENTRDAYRPTPYPHRPIFFTTAVNLGSARMSSQIGSIFSQ